jgi:hypothetical protein
MRNPSAILLAVSVLAASPAWTAGPGATSATSPRGAVLAVEDTMRTEVPEVLVRAPRVTLAEILDRVAEGEAKRDSLLRDQSYQLTVRLVGHAADGKTPQLVEESVTRVYQRRPDQTRTVPLRHWRAKPPKRPGAKAEVNVEIGGVMNEDIVNFAFKPSARRDYRYRIVGRQILGNHVVYRLAFEPRSALSVYEPSGEVWVDTRDDVIVRQEITFRQSPVPLFLRGLDRMVVERQQVEGFWVLGRVLARVRTTIPLPQFGTSLDLAIQLSDYTVNTGLPDSLFAAPAAKVELGDTR